MIEDAKPPSDEEDADQSLAHKAGQVFVVVLFLCATVLVVAGTFALAAYLFGMS